jgi:hypothetical protein
VNEKNNNFLISNVSVFYSIAQTASRRSKELTEQAKTPMPGEPGRFVIKWDPGQEGFKNAFVAIVFSGVYLDALLNIEGARRLGEDKYRKLYMQKYEDRLKALDVTDAQLLIDCEKFRGIRNEVTHEKAIFADPLTGVMTSLGSMEISTAQEDAWFSASFIDRVTTELKKLGGMNDM